MPGSNWHGIGFAKVYQRSSDGGDWELEQTILGEANADQLGYSVSLSSNGKTVAVGAPGHYKRKDKTGYVKVYHKLDGDWKQLDQAIKGEALRDMFGRSVSLSADGKTLAVGAASNDENGSASGHVRVFSLDDRGSTWQQLGQDIDGEAAYDRSGFSVSLSSDGNIVAIGAFLNNGKGENSGHVRVYRMDVDSWGWKQLGQDIDGEASGDASGYSVSLSADGRTVAIGAHMNDGNGDVSGHVRVYQMDDTSSIWKQIGQDIDGEAAYDHSGVSVSLSADGKTVAIGANGNDGNSSNISHNSGHVRVYYMDESIWKQLGQDIDGESTWISSGYSVSISADGRSVAIGSVRNDHNGPMSGHVSVFNQVSS